MKKQRDWLLWIIIAVGVVSIPFACIGNYYVNKARYPNAPDWSHWGK